MHLVLAAHGLLVCYMSLSVLLNVTFYSMSAFFIICYIQIKMSVQLILMRVITIVIIVMVHSLVLVIMDTVSMLMAKHVMVSEYKKFGNWV